MSTISGTMIHNGPLSVSRLCLRGDGPVGNDPTGPKLLFAHSGDGIVLGRGDPYRATGSRLFDFGIIKAAGYFGGAAFSAIAISKAERPGEIVADGLQILDQAALDGSSRGNWNDGVVWSAPSLTEPSASGTRVNRFRRGRIAGCLGDAIRLENCVHCWVTETQVDPGSAGNIPIVRIVGGDHIFLHGNNVTGMIIVEGNASNVIISGGFAQQIWIRSGCRNVIVDGVIERNLTVDTGVTGRSRALVPNVVNRSSGFSIDRF